MQIAIRYAVQLLDHLAEITARAQAGNQCKRKAVGCALVRLDQDGVVREMVFEKNGPTQAECTGQIGNCGCAHAEPRAMIQALTKSFHRSPSKLVLLCTYSPCTNCANVIIDSNIVAGVIREHLTQHDVRGEDFLKGKYPVLTRAELQLLVNVESSPSNYAAQEARAKTARTVADWVN